MPAFLIAVLVVAVDQATKAIAVVKSWPSLVRNTGAAFGLFRLWGWALGFAAGALVSLGSLRLIVATVARFTEQPSSERRGQRGWWVGSLVRLLGAAVLLFLVVRYLPVNLIGSALLLLTSGGIYAAANGPLPAG